MPAGIGGLLLVVLAETLALGGSGVFLPWRSDAPTAVRPPLSRP